MMKNNSKGDSLIICHVIPGDGEDRNKGILGYRVDVWLAQDDRIFQKVTKIYEERPRQEKKTE